MRTNSTTPIISTSEPLVPLKFTTYPIVASLSNVSSPNVIQFDETCKNLKLNKCDTVSPVCNVIFCDRQSRGDCPCMEVCNTMTLWEMTAEVKNGQLHHPATLRSKNLLICLPQYAKTLIPTNAFSTFSTCPTALRHVSSTLMQLFLAALYQQTQHRKQPTLTLSCISFLLHQ